MVVDVECVTFVVRVGGSLVVVRNNCPACLCL